MRRLAFVLGPWILWIHAVAAAQGAEGGVSDGGDEGGFDAEFGEDPTFPTDAPAESTSTESVAESARSESERPPDADADAETDPSLEVFEDSDTHWLFSLGALITAPVEAGWDRHIGSRGYGEPSPTYGADLGVLYRATRWLNIGVRLAARHRHWLHWELPAATLFGTDVLVSLDARLSPGRVFQVGLHASGGLGLASVSINGERDVRALGRFQGGPLFTFKLHGTLRAMVRLAYDHARVELAPDVRANLGGFTLLVGFEVRE